MPTISIGNVLVGHVDLDPTAERLLAGKVVAGEGLAHGDDVARLALLEVGEEAAAQKSDAHDPEVAVVADANLGAGLLALRRSGIADDDEVGGGPESRKRQEADGPRGAHAGQRPDPVEGLLEEPHDLRVLLVAGAREVDAGRQDALAREARVDAAERAQALQHESGADEEHDGEGDLGHDEDLAQPAGPRPGAALARALLERLLDVGPGAGEGRGEAADRRGQDATRTR